MNPYRYLQSRMARFVLESNIVNEEAQVDVPFSEDADVTFADAAEQKDLANEKKKLYIYNLTATRYEDEDKSKKTTNEWQRMVNAVTTVLTLPINLFVQQGKDVIEDDELEKKIAETIFKSIEDEYMTAEHIKFIRFKDIDAERAERIRKLVNEQLAKENIEQIPAPDPEDKYSFHPIAVDEHIENTKGVILDTMHIQPEAGIKTGKYIINCAARGRTYLDFIDDMQKDANVTGATVVGFNYRSLGASTGQLITQQDIIDDIVAQVRALLKSGVKQEDICLNGLCLGGAFATLAAAELREKHDITVDLYVSRPFKKFSRTIAEFALPRKYDTWPSWIAKIVFIPFVLIVVGGFLLYNKALDWEVDVSKALEKVDPNHVDYDYAKPSEKDAKAGYAADKLILEENSPYKQLQEKIEEQTVNRVEREKDMVDEADAKARIGLGIDVMINHQWPEEEMQFEFSEIVAEAIEKLQEDINNEATPEGQIPYLKDQLVKLQQVKKGLDVAVRGNPLAHQLKRANEEEKSYNPHATPADKLVAYGLKGTARNALSMFVNRDQKQPASEQEPSIASREESSTSSLGKTP